MTDAPLVDEGQWILIGSAQIKGLVINMYNNGHLGVGHYQNSKALKEDVVWEGEQWELEQSGSSPEYLRGTEAATVKRGPSASLLRRG